MLVDMSGIGYRRCLTHALTMPNMQVLSEWSKDVSASTKRRVEQIGRVNKTQQDEIKPTSSKKTLHLRHVNAHEGD